MLFCCRKVYTVCVIGCVCVCVCVPKHNLSVSSNSCWRHVRLTAAFVCTHLQHVVVVAAATQIIWHVPTIYEHNDAFNYVTCAQPANIMHRELFGRSVMLK